MSNPSEVFICKLNMITYVWCLKLIVYFCKSNGSIGLKHPLLYNQEKRGRKSINKQSKDNHRWAFMKDYSM